MGHSARLTMESHACPNSTKIDDSTKLEAKEVGSSAVAGELDLNTSPKKELASNEGDGTEASFNPAKDIVQPAALEAESRAFKHEDENERKASSDGTAATVTPSLTEKRNEELLSQSHEIISAVPDIVVEHVPAKDAHSRGLTPPFVVISISNLTPSSSFRQIRALSDSSVHVSHSSYIPPGNTEFRHLQPHIWRSLGDMDETCQLRSKDSDLQEELSLRTGLKKCRISRLSAVIEPDQGDAETFEPVRAEVSASPCHLHSYKSHFRQGKSPKTYWMRRHSDSNLSTPPGSGLRPEPYPVRSRSTGDSVPGAVAPCETAISGVGDKESPRSSIVNEQRGTPDSSERFSPDEKVTGLYKKRLKLKKYLQTRYQTSLREMRQSSDADDVFACSPTLVTSPEPVRMHINVPSVTPAPLSPMSFEVYENRSQRQFLSQQQQGSSPGTCTKELYHEKVGGSSCDPSEPMYRAGVKPGVAMEESLSPASTCSSEVPVFIFPVASTSNLSVSPSSFPRQYSQSLVSPSFTATTLEFEHLAVTSPSGSDVSGLVNSPSRVTSSLSGFHDIHTYQNVASKNPEVPGVSSELPMFVDSPYDKPCPAGYPRQFSPWEASDKHAQILALARPQSHNSLLPYSPGSEPPNYQIARFPSMPVLSDTSPSHWQEFGEVSPVLISSPVIRLASMSLNKSFEAKPGYSQIQEGGVERDDSTLARSQFTCPLCGQEFVSYGLLANHMSSHLPAEGATKDSSAEAQRVHICRVCNRSFSRSDMLTRHARLHTGLRPYECHLCGQVFSRSDHLHTHLRTHTGEKPYKCTYCPYAAPRRDMVTRHMRIHTRDVPHRGRRSSSVSSDVPTSPVYSDLTGLQVEEVELIMMQSLSDIGSLRRSGRDYSRGSAATADVDLGPAQRLVSCRTCSLTSCESTEGSDISHSFPACRAWSSTSTESFESFSSPRTRDQLSWSSSTDSPDVFSRNHQQFFWSARPGYVRPPERSGAPSSTAVDTLSVEMQTSFERCTVTASERDERRHAAKDKCAEVKIKKERKFDSEDDYVI